MHYCLCRKSNDCATGPWLHIPYSHVNLSLSPKCPWCKYRLFHACASQGRLHYKSKHENIAYRQVFPSSARPDRNHTDSMEMASRKHHLQSNDSKVTCWWYWILVKINVTNGNAWFLDHYDQSSDFITTICELGPPIVEALRKIWITFFIWAVSLLSNIYVLWTLSSHC